MAKKGLKKVSKKRASNPKKTRSAKVVKKTEDDYKIERILVENFIALQKVMTNLSAKFDNLANQISKLLELFEISAKALAEKDFNIERKGANTEAIAKKMDSLLEQNKIIARGMTLINDRILEKNTGEVPQGMPGAIMQINPNQQTMDMQGYQKSISSRSSNFPPRPIK